MNSIEEQAMHAAEDVEPVNSREPRAHTDIISPSTTSMVTVRLSDSEPSKPLVEPELEHDDVDATSRTRLSVDDIEFAHPPKSIMDDEEVQTSHDNGIGEPRRTSAISGSSEVHDVGAASVIDPSSNRSRRGSSSTTSSASSARVDWDELEKTEEQEPRDETSDEVHLLFS